MTKGDPHGKTDAPSTGAAWDPCGCCVDGLCGGVVNGLREGGGYFSGQDGRIAYPAYDGIDYEIYTTNSRGGDEFQVTNNNRDDYSPSYSPGGKRIAYVEFDRNNAEICTIRVGGRDEIQLTNNKADESGPSWGVVRSGFSCGREGDLEV